MSDMIRTLVRCFGDSIEVTTAKNTPDAQRVHTAAYIAAYNELRHREADRVRDFNPHTAETLGKPVKIGTRENPTHLRTDRRCGPVVLWRPVLPLTAWEAPKPVSDKTARERAAKLDGSEHRVLGQLVGQISFWEEGAA